jgi:hypothetical protein
MEFDSLFKEMQKALESGTKSWADIMEEEEAAKEAEEDRLAIARGEEAPSKIKARKRQEEYEADKKRREEQQKEEEARHLAEIEKEEDFRAELEVRIDLADDERKANREIPIPIGIEGYHNIANDDFFYGVLQAGDRILLQRIRNRMPSVEFVTIKSKHGDGFVYMTKSGSEYEADWDNLIFGDESIKTNMDNRKAFKILKIYPDGVEVDFDAVKATFVEAPPAVEEPALTPPFDVPTTATPEFFKKNLAVNQVLIAKRYKPGKGGLVKVQNNLVVEKKFDEGVRVKYLYDGRVVWVNNVTYANIFGDESALPALDNAIYVSKVLVADEAAEIPKLPATTVTVESPVVTTTPVLSRTDIYKRDIKVGTKLRVNRLKPDRKNPGNFIVVKDNEMTVIDVTPVGARVQYEFGTSRWDGFIPFANMFDKQADLVKSATEKALQIIEIKNTAGGNKEIEDEYYAKYLKYKAKYIKLKNSQ